VEVPLAYISGLVSTFSNILCDWVFFVIFWFFFKAVCMGDMIIHHRLHCLLLLVSHVLGFHCAHLHYSIMAVSWNLVWKPTFTVILVMAIGSRLKPEICFLPGWPRWILLPKESCGDSLSGCGLNTQPSNWEADTLPLPEIQWPSWQLLLSTSYNRNHWCVWQVHCPLIELSGKETCWRFRRPQGGTVAPPAPVSGRGQKEHR